MNLKKWLRATGQDGGVGNIIRVIIGNIINSIVITIYDRFQTYQENRLLSYKMSHHYAVYLNLI